MENEQTKQGERIRLFTRAQLAVAIEQATGVPISKGRLDKAAMNGGGPAPACYIGVRPFYTLAAGLHWFDEQLVRPVLNTDRPTAA